MFDLTYRRRSQKRRIRLLSVHRRRLVVSLINSALRELRNSAPPALQFYLTFHFHRTTGEQSERSFAKDTELQIISVIILLVAFTAL